MNIACIGGGPAGLYLGILVKRVAPEHDVTIYERNRPDDTFGFGVVFSDATLGNLAAADPESHAQITSHFARWDDIEIHIGGEVLRSTGHGFCGLERKKILEILQARATGLGVKVHFEHAITSLAAPELANADVIVACDGVASWVRDALAKDLAPHVDVRPNRFVWLGTTVPYEAFTFLFVETPHGMYRVHAYPFAKGRSTFIVECREETWRAAGLAEADEDTTIAILEGVFAEHLRGHRLIKNRSIWRQFPTVRCGTWSSKHRTEGSNGLSAEQNIVLVGDAAHTAHFSIGSGTKLAMEDVIALRDELLASPTEIPRALAAYEAKRRPEVLALQAAAQASLEWFEGTERYMRMPPVQFTYSLMTRSLRVSHASVGKRDPHLAAGVEQLLARGERPMRPIALPWTLGDRVLRSRVVVAPEVGARSDFDDLLVTLGGPAQSGAALVVSPLLAATAIAADDTVVAWQRVVDFVHRKHGLIAARLALPAGITEAELHAAVERLAFADFDLLLLDPGKHEGAIEALPALASQARRRWRIGGLIGAVVGDRPTARAAVVGHTAQLVRAGIDVVWATAEAATTRDGARLPAAPLADRLRNELRIPVAIEAGAATGSDLDAAIAAGRADLVVVPRIPS